MSPTLHLFLLALATLAYCVLHSLLASRRCKDWVGRRWPRLVPAYRLLFNLIAVVTLIPVGWLLWSWEGAQIWTRPPLLRWLLDGLALLAVAAFLHSLRAYDSGVFSGLAQWRSGAADADGSERLRIGFWHRMVRHPWYFFGLVILWTRDLDAAQLLFYALLSLYLWIGSRLEERKLIARHGDAYRAYRRRVPGLIPWRGLALSRAEAEALEAQGASAMKVARTGAG